MRFTPYLNVEEIESAVEVAATTWPDLCQLITLRHTTFEGLTSHFLCIAGGPMTHRSGVLLIGAVHARDRGSSAILVSLVERRLSASILRWTSATSTQG